MILWHRRHCVTEFTPVSLNFGHRALRGEWRSIAIPAAFPLHPTRFQDSMALKPPVPSPSQGLPPSLKLRRTGRRAGRTKRAPANCCNPLQINKPRCLNMREQSKQRIFPFSAILVRHSFSEGGSMFLILSSLSEGGSSSNLPFFLHFSFCILHFEFCIFF